MINQTQRKLYLFVFITETNPYEQIVGKVYLKGFSNVCLWMMQILRTNKDKSLMIDSEFGDICYGK